MKHKFAIFILITSVLQVYAQQNNKWTNWALNQTCTTKEIFKPKSNQELIEFLKKAKKEKSNVRVTGSGHSWNDIVCNNDYLIDIGNLNKVLDIDKKNKTIKVQAGIKICDLNKALAKENLALSNQSAIDIQTIAGATATATHGTGHTGTLSSFIKNMELITGDGKIHQLTNNSDYLATARVSIGSLGVITALTLQCEDLFELQQKNYTMKLVDILKYYKKFNKENDFFLFTWNPYNNLIKINTENKIYRKNMQAKKMHDTCFQGVKIGDLKMRRQEEEVAIPVEQLPSALLKLEKFFKSHAKLGVKIYGEVLCRFVKTDKDCLLSPTYDRDSVFISINMLPDKNNNYKKFLKEYEDLLVNEFNGRPHWGKVNFIDNKRAEKLYGKNLSKFISIRDKLDPDKMFSNTFTKRVFNS